MIIQLVSVLAAGAMTVATDTAAAPGSGAQISMREAVEIALGQNASVKVADLEIRRTGYALKGTYAALFPQIDFSGSYQRTIEKQVMYMDSDTVIPGMENGISVGRWNTTSAAVSAQLPLVNFQLWESIRISGDDVEIAVEKARSSRLETVAQVRQAYLGVLLAKEAFEVYKDVYDNARANYDRTNLKFASDKASSLDVARAATTLANAVPNVYDAECSVGIALWRLKAVMGVDLDSPIDTRGCLDDYAEEMCALASVDDTLDLSGNSSLRQLALQADELASAVKMQEYACLPSLSLAFSYSYSAMANDFKFEEYKWTPYSYLGVSLNIPIFAGGKRSQAVKQAKLQAAELDLQRIDTERQTRILIRQYIGTMETAVKSYDSALKAREAAQKAYDITAESYSLGSSTLTDLNDAQLALTQASLSVCQAIYNYHTARTNLEMTLGTEI